MSHPFRHIFYALLLVTVAVCYTLTSEAAIAADSSEQLGVIDIGSASQTPTANKQPMIIPAAPTMNAKAYVIIDAGTGQIIAQKDMNERLPPASLTKMMSLYIFSEALTNKQINLDDKVHISQKAWKTGGSRMFIKAGDDVVVSDLLQGIIVASGNDATMAMAEHVAGSEEGFVPLMNAEAKTLGMNDTNYTDPTGLPKPDHYTSAHDIALLARALINNYPQYYHWYSQKWFDYAGIKQSNRNRLLWRDPSVDGVKTGHTDDAGFCLVASAQRDGMRLISVVMGAPSDNDRDDYNEQLLNYGFRFYKSYKVYQANEPLIEARAWLGAKENVPLGLTQDLKLTLPIGKLEALKSDISIDKELKAPIEKGKVYGKLTVSLDDKVIAVQPLIALSNDPKGGLWTWFMDYMGLLWHKFLSLF